MFTYMISKKLAGKCSCMYHPKTKFTEKLLNNGSFQVGMKKKKKETQVTKGFRAMKQLVNLNAVQKL